MAMPFPDMDKLKSLLDEPDRYEFRVFNYGGSIGVSLPSQRTAWICGYDLTGYPRNDDGDWLIPDGERPPYIAEEELAKYLNSR